MNRITQAFAHGKKPRIHFVAAGDPNMASTQEKVTALQKDGADILLIGVPFSDPVVETPTVQQAYLRALAAGATVDGIFDMVAQWDKTGLPAVILVVYANAIYAYGSDRFMARCARSGIDGVMISDLPHEERGEFAQAFSDHGICRIAMLTPTTPRRVAAIVQEAEGFLYCLPALGRTHAQLEDILNQVKTLRDIPCVAAEEIKYSGM